ncbi:MAG: hypothetical protein KHX65_09235 [Bifidobacterium sp.]|uniref:hypothetical protein n=1 Tax=Bifidobacterium TaxID=1678 RepID=UPI00257AC7D2|nr:hypothetical protein [Bifidobacterium sp.]MBS5402085.1 hypothetical protein [Bifidobacterium sp.]
MANGDIIRYADYFEIKGDIPFEDLNVYNDNKMYLDPHLIRNAPESDSYSSLAKTELRTFLDCLSEKVLHEDETGRELLTHLNEPPETRLGMSRTGSYGHAADSKLGSAIWKTVREDLAALWRLGIIHHFEDLPIFIKGIGNDITSDITTRIVYDALAKFTENCMEQFPELRAKDMKCINKHIWDSSSLKWVERTYQLPAIGNIPVVLIPQGWADVRLQGLSERFFSKSVLDYRIEQSGHPKPSKKQLRRKLPGNHCQYNIDAAIEARESGARRDLVNEFWRYVDDHRAEEMAK